MRIDVATADEIRAVALRMRDADLAEFSAVNVADDRWTIAEALVDRYGTRDDIFCAFNDEDEPVAIGAVVVNRPNVATLFFFATDGFRSVARGLTRWIRKELFPRVMEEGEVHRIECWSMDGHDTAHRWIEHLGLERRFKDEGFGKNGEAFVLFTRLADVRPPAS